MAGNVRLGYATLNYGTSRIKMGQDLGNRPAPVDSRRYRSLFVLHGGKGGQWSRWGAACARAGR